MSITSVISKNRLKIQGKYGVPVSIRGYILGKTIGKGSYCKVKESYKKCENGKTNEGLQSQADFYAARICHRLPPISGHKSS
jgi:hypothetical protein